MSTLLRKQPFKGLYITYELITTVFARVPIWFILALPKSWRPRASWSIKRVILVNLIKRRAYVASRAGQWWTEHNYTAVDPDPHYKGVWIRATPELIVGDVKKWASLAGVEPIRIPGYWHNKEGTSVPVGAAPRSGEKVVYALHGGAYARLSAHPNDPTSNIVKGLLKHTGSEATRALTLEYRLSKSPNDPQTPANPFPAALLDAIAGYNYLLNDVGFAPEDIIVEGDSAGGNLALALVRYLVENQNSSEAAIPRPPGGLVLLSPWVDLGPMERSSPTSSYYTNIPSDFINVTTPAMATTTGNFFGPLGPEAGVSNRYISPASLSPAMEGISFKGFPPTLIILGGAEVLSDQIRILGARMAADLGDKVHLEEYEGGIHDFTGHLWHDPERTEAFKLISKWIRTV